MRQEAHHVLIKCLDKLQAAPGEGYKPLARAIVTNRFREIVREEHLRGQWVQCELSDAVLSHDCKDVSSFNDEFFTRELERYRGYYQKSRERILKKVRERWAANYEHEREYARQYYQSRRDKITTRRLKYYHDRRDERRAVQNERYRTMSEEEKAKRKEYSRKYYEAHKEEIKARQRENTTRGNRREMLKIKIYYWDGSKKTVYIRTEAAKQLLERICTESEAWNSHEIIRLKITKIADDEE